MYISSLKPLLTYGRFFLQQERRFLPHLYANPNKFPLTQDKTIDDKHKLHISPFLSTVDPYQPTPPQFLFTQPETKEEISKKIVRNSLQNRVRAIQYEGNAQIQDRLIVSQLNSIQAYTISVFDGHGGSLLANYASNKITSLIEAFIERHKNEKFYKQNKDKLITDSLIQAYESLQNNFYEDVYKQQIILQNKKVKNIGTCALTILVHDDKIYVANCGDSQAIVVSQEIQSIQYTKLNQRLSVNNPHERQRLYSQFPDDQDIIVEEIKGCYYLKGRLQPTRSLGDYHLKKGLHWKGKGEFRGPYIKYEPQINIFPIKTSYKYIVIASDGIWDIMDKWSVSRISLQRDPHQNILGETIKKVAQLHKKSEQQIRGMCPGQRRCYHDDISLAVVDLSNQLDDK